MYDGRPVFVMEVLSTLNADSPWSFRLKNCGERTARFVNLNSVISQGESPKYRLNFQQILAISANAEEHLYFWVSDISLSKSLPLKLFLDEHASDAALIWWDIEIKFRDTNEVIEHGGTVRLCFDVERNVLYTTSVPYTAHGAKRP